MKKKTDNIRALILSSVFAAIVFVSTAYLPRFPIVSGGYVHIGDAFIYLSACILPTPYACAVGAVGAGIADSLTGYVVYLPATIIIKALMAVFFSSKKSKILSKRNVFAVVPAGFVCVLGYYLYEVLLMRSFLAPIVSLYFNFAQAVASAVLFVVLALLFDKFGLIKLLQKQDVDLM